MRINFSIYPGRLDLRRGQLRERDFLNTQIVRARKPRSLVGKRGSCRQSPKGFSKNAAVTEKS